MLKHSVVVAELRALVADNEDRKSYCAYVDGTGEPVCIVGHIFARLCPSVLDEIREAEAVRVSVLALSSFGVEVPMSMPTLELLWAIQRYQDAGLTWGEALEFSGHA